MPILPIKIPVGKASVSGNDQIKCMARAIYLAANNNFVDVINLSSSTNPGAIGTIPSGTRPNIGTASLRLEIMNAVSLNKIVVTTAGDDEKNLDQYNTQSLPGVIVVGGSENDATTNRSVAWRTSSLGNSSISDSNGSCYGIIVDMIAGARFSAYSGGYGTQVKTSISAPIVSVAAGMVKSFAANQSNISLTPDQVKSILIGTATLGGDTPGAGPTKSTRYFGKDLNKPSINVNGQSNIRDLNLFNALIVAKNVSKYDAITRTFNGDDYLYPYYGGNSNNAYGWEPYKNDTFYGLSGLGTNSMILYGNLYRKISNFIVSDIENKLYALSEKEIKLGLNYSQNYKIILNNKGNGFVSFKTTYSGICPDLGGYLNKCGDTNRYYIKINNYAVTSEQQKDIFDSISIDENGNGILYTYSNAVQEYKLIDSVGIFNRYNNITFKKINNFNISEKEEILDKLNNLNASYTPDHLILSPTGNGQYFYFTEQGLYVKKVNDFITEKNYSNVGKFEYDHNIGVVKDYDLDSLRINNLDNNGNGYIYFSTGKGTINVIPLKEYILMPEKSFIVNSINYPKELDKNGNGQYVYLEKSNNVSHDLKVQYISNYINTNTIIIKSFPINTIVPDFQDNNLLNFYLKNGKGFIVWYEQKDSNINEIYLKYISDFNFDS